MKPHKCPVCDGAGHVWRPPGVPGDQETWASSEIKSYPCAACAGTGIVWEKTDCSISDPLGAGLSEKAREALGLSETGENDNKTG